MSTKMKATVLTAVLFFTMLAGAQEKYDFAMVYIDATKPIVHVIQNDVPEKVIDTGKKNTDIVGQEERLLSVVSQLTSEGWEVISTSVGRFYLRKKK